MSSDSRRQAAEGVLHARSEALRRREESMDLRETTADAGEALARTHADRLAESGRQTREANERLVIASMRSQALTEAAEQANALKDDFLAMLSHELRNPLAPIRNATAILGRISHAEPRLPWIHGVIERQIEQMTRLLDDLLDVARVRSGKIVLLKRPVLAREFIEQAIESCRPFAESRGQQLTVDLPAELVYVQGDPVRLTQVFANLLNNAAKYTGKGGAITVRAGTDETTLTVRVIDTGSGLTQEALTRIFELFAQEDRSLAHAEGGLGIGLTIVRRLVELHGGTVTATSAGLNEGSEFTVTLPLLHPPAAAPPEPQRAATAPAALRMRIVVIEDNLDANDTLSTLLTLEGHEVASAYDGVSGMALVRANRPQIVLCDIGLPGQDGLAVAAQLREELRDTQPFLVALTGYGQAQDRARGLLAGFDAYLTKPVSIPTLLALIDAHAEGFVS